MSLSKSQLYCIKKEKSRKTKVIVAAVKREMGQGASTITTRIVKARINKELHMNFGISKMEDLPERDYKRALGVIRGYRFNYCGKHYG